MKAMLLYHYFYPDDVISARLFTDLGEHLQQKGWEVTALPCTRSCRNPDIKYSRHDIWRNIHIERVDRPGLDQSTTSGRILNGLFMMSAWVRQVLRHKPDIIIVGTDPPASAAFMLPIRKYLPRTKVILWAHDVYPELIAADNPEAAGRVFYRMLKNITAKAYMCCDAIVDLGPSMRSRLCKYQFNGIRDTISPWALSEPDKISRPDIERRHKLFGDAKLALLYSGNYGRAHDAGPLIELARKLKSDGVSAAFSVRGNRVSELSAMIKPDDTNIKVTEISDEADLRIHLEAADIHMISLKAGFAGLAVPSKFFGALAAGRPVIYSGPPESDIAQMMSANDIGWMTGTSGIESVVCKLRELATGSADLTGYFNKAHDAYTLKFSKKIMLSRWEKLLDKTA